MLSIMSVSAPYFFSLARLLLERAGKRDAFGVTYDDREMEVRGSPDGGTIQVRSKGYGSDVPAMVVASRGPDGETFASEHSFVASHLQHVVSRSIEGEHVFTFSIAGQGGGVAETRTLLATGLADAVRHLREGRLAVVDLLKVGTPEEARVSGIDVEGCEATVAVRDARDLEACRRSAAGSTEQVYLFTSMPREGKAESWLAKRSPFILAVGLRDAEETCLRSLDGDRRIVKVEIQTLAEFYDGPGASRHARQSMVLSHGSNAAAG